MCFRGAISINNDIAIDRKICETCDSIDCYHACFHQALRPVNRKITVSDTLSILERDSKLWSLDGGVTLSSGEPLMQSEFVLSLLRECNAKGYNTAIEISVLVPSSIFAEAVALSNWLFVDLKHMNSAIHKSITGADKHRILANIRATASFVRDVGLNAINLLPYHNFGASKYETLGMQGFVELTDDDVIGMLVALDFSLKNGVLECPPGYAEQSWQGKSPYHTYCKPKNIFDYVIIADGEGISKLPGEQPAIVCKAPKVGTSVRIAKTNAAFGTRLRMAIPSDVQCSEHIEFGWIPHTSVRNVSAQTFFDALAQEKWPTPKKRECNGISGILTLSTSSSSFGSIIAEDIGFSFDIVIAGERSVYPDFADGSSICVKNMPEGKTLQVSSPEQIWLID